jgi:hypothetical protein
MFPSEYKQFLAHANRQLSPIIKSLNIWTARNVVDLTKMSKNFFTFLSIAAAKLNDPNLKRTPKTIVYEKTLESQTSFLIQKLSNFELLKC